MQESHNPVYNEVLVEMPILEFVQGRIQDLVTGMVKKDRHIYNNNRVWTWWIFGISGLSIN
jgi:hypothetical protein